MYRLLITISILSFSSSFSQIKIFGTVKNEEGKVIQGVNIYEEKQDKGTPTDENGVYEIELKKDTVRLEFSHLGYLKKVMIIYPKDLKKKIFLNVTLKEKKEVLRPVEVNSSPIKTILNKDNLLIKDFDFFGDDLILLLKSPDRGYFLELRDEITEKTVKFSIPFRPKELEIDCFGNIQVLAKDSVYQVAIQDDQIHIADRFKMDDYEEFIRPCILENDSLYAFQYYGEHGKSIKYTLFPKDTNQQVDSIMIIDQVGFRVAAEYYIEIIQLYNGSVSYGDNVISNGIWDGDMKDLNVSPKLNQMIGFYEHVLSKPNYSPIFTKNNEILIFDHTNGILYKQGNWKDRISINYHETKNWIKLVLYDKWEDKYVTFFKENGLYTAHYININTGKLEKGVLLEENAYPENLKLKKGYIYYLHKSLNAFYGNELLKQKISNPK